MSDIEKREGVRSPLRDLSNSPVNSGGLGGLAGLTKSAPAAPTFGLGSLLDNKDVYSLQASSGLGLGLGGLGAAKPSSNNQDLADNLLQSKIGHLEKERAELGAQIQEKDEEIRRNRLRVERLEMTVKEMEETNSATTENLSVLTKEKEQYLKQISSLSMINASNDSSNTLPPPPGGSVASQLAEALSKPPAYISSDDPATQGIWQKMSASAKELIKMEKEVNSMRKEKDEALAACDKKLAEQEELMTKQQAKMDIDRETMVALKNAAAEADKLAQRADEAEKDSGNVAGLLQDAMSNLEKMDGEMGAEKEKNAALAVEMATLGDQITYLENEIRSMEDREARAVEEAKQMAIQRAKELESRSEDDVIAKFIESGGDESLLQLIEDLRAKLGASEAKRKKLHSELQDLRGNVRVLVRARPFLRGDGDNTQTCLVPNKDCTSMSVIQPNKPPSLYHFDHVFDSNTSQERVYGEVNDLIQSALDGYRVCIFSYGQTGSGKTWTMSGERLGSNRGIIPRAVEQIIEQTLGLKEQGWDMTVSVSVLELYNEDLKDLLPEGAAAVMGEKSKDKLKISMQQGRVQVAGLNSVSIDTTSTHSGMRQLEALLEKSGRARTTVATGMNERSSRSHMIFMMELHGVHSDGTTVTRGGLRLVDLAGSERLDRTGTLNDAARLKETVNINKSLSCLADVFVNLGNKSAHIPYRNSKLTMLLQDCLSGDGKALMIVNVSPTQASTNETICSLRFADQVSQVELGKAQKQMYTTMPVKEDKGNSASSNGVARASTRSRDTEGGDIENTTSRGVKRSSTVAVAAASNSLNTSSGSDISGKDTKRTRTSMIGGMGAGRGRWQ